MTFTLNKKIPVILLALLLLVACGGCGSSPTEEPQKEESTPTSTETETTTEPDEQPAEETSSEEEPESTDSTESSETEPKAEEPASTDSTESTAPPKYLVDYLGMTVDEVTAIWGEDYSLWGELYDGEAIYGGSGLYYDDLRTEIMFYFYSPSLEEMGNSEIKILDASDPDLWIEEGMPCRVTLTDLEKMDLPGTPDGIQLNDTEHYWYNIKDNIFAYFYWSSAEESGSAEPAYTEYPMVTVVGYEN